MHNSVSSILTIKASYNFVKECKLSVLTTAFALMFLLFYQVAVKSSLFYYSADNANYFTMWINVIEGESGIFLSIGLTVSSKLRNLNSLSNLINHVLIEPSKNSFR